MMRTEENGTYCTPRTRLHGKQPELVSHKPMYIVLSWEVQVLLTEPRT